MAYWLNAPVAGYADIRCSACRTVFKKQTGLWKFCPECGEKMHKRSSAVTERQADFIKSIEEALGISFDGETKEEASAFISKHLAAYKLITAGQNALDKEEQEAQQD